MPESDAVAGALMRPLRLAVDALDLLRDQRGIGTYVRALLLRFAQRDDIRLTLLVRDWFPRRFAPALRAAIGVADGAQVRCVNRVPRDADVIWHPWNGTFFGSAAPAVATIHDVIPFALPAADEVQRASQQAPIRRTAAAARAIVCDSHFTAADVARYLGVAPDRLHVVALGVDPIFSPGSIDALPTILQGRRYVLYVGAHDEHKNVMTLVAAHRAAFGGSTTALVFTQPNPAVPEAIVCENAATPTLVALYCGASIVAIPSLYEGFGLPLLEALACGAPALASRATSLPEVGGDVAAYVDNARDPAAWAHALRELIVNIDARARMAVCGPARAATFTWERCAQRTFDVLRSVAEKT